MPPEEKLIAVSLALEEALMREAWDEADDLFAARDTLYQTIPVAAVPREVDDADIRILNFLRNGLNEVRRELLTVDKSRRAAQAYTSAPSERAMAIG